MLFDSWMFYRKKLNARAVFLEGVKRAQYQFIIWKSASDIYPDKPMPDNYGWKRCDKYISVMRTLPPAPKALLQPIKYGCSKYVCETSRCKCKDNHLYCTDLCCCGAEKDPCKNFPVSNLLMSGLIWIQTV